MVDIQLLRRLAQGEALIEPESLRFSDDFLKLQHEIGKLQSLSGEEPDWLEVQKLAEKLIVNKQTDILVLVYFAVALVKLKGLSGFATACQLLKNCFLERWEVLYPPLKKGKVRANAIAWLFEQWLGDIESLMARSSWSEAQLQVAFDSLQELQGQLQEKLPELSLSWHLIRKPIESQKQLLEQQRLKREAEANARKAAEQKKAEERHHIEQSRLDPISQAMVNGDLLEWDSARVEHEPLLAAQYHANRFQAWFGPNFENLLTACHTSQLPWALIGKAFEAYYAENYHFALGCFEQVFAKYPFWLTGQYWQYRCCEQIGEAAIGVKDVIVTGLRQLWQTQPDLLVSTHQTGWYWLDPALRVWAFENVFFTQYDWLHSPAVGSLMDVALPTQDPHLLAKFANQAQGLQKVSWMYLQACALWNLRELAGAQHLFATLYFDVFYTRLLPASLTVAVAKQLYACLNAREHEGLSAQEKKQKEIVSCFLYDQYGSI